MSQEIKQEDLVALAALAERLWPALAALPSPDHVRGVILGLLVRNLVVSGDCASEANVRLILRKMEEGIVKSFREIGVFQEPQ